MAFIEVSDLTPFAPDIDETKAAAMIADATAMAVMEAPGLAYANTENLDQEQFAAVKAILRRAILRWNDAGGGAVSAQAAGPFSMSVDTRQPHRAMFRDDEIAALRKICTAPTDGGVFSVDTATATPQTVHPAFGGWHGWSGTQGGWAWNDNGQFIPNNFI